MSLSGRTQVLLREAGAAGPLYAHQQLWRRGGMQSQGVPGKGLIVSVGQDKMVSAGNYHAGERGNMAGQLTLDLCEGAFDLPMLLMRTDFVRKDFISLSRQFFF